MAAVIKKDAIWLIAQLPDDATWDDVLYRAYICREVEAGMADSAAGRVASIDEALAEFGLRR